MAKKRYAVRGPQGLLRRLLTVVDLGPDVYGPIETSLRSVKACRDVFSELLAAPVGGVVAGPHARRELEGWRDRDVHVCREVIMGGVLWSMIPKDLKPRDSVAGGWEAQLRFAAVIDGANVLTRIDGSALDVLVVQILGLLRVAGVERLRFCAECSRRFVRVGRQEFCSKRCQNRDSQRRYRESLKSPHRRANGKKTRAK